LTLSLPAPAEPVLATLALGGNTGAVVDSFILAIQHLAQTEGVALVALSDVWRSPAWGITHQPDFLNAAMMIRTNLAPHAMLDLCLSLEKAAGRERRVRWGPRPLDLDIITYGTVHCDLPDLVLPHPGAKERAFVLVPLRTIAPDLVLGTQSVATLCAGVDLSMMQRDDEASQRLAAVARTLIPAQGGTRCILRAPQKLLDFWDKRSEK
jgi:2-amino-4-hydroxy-6-hydroxymethyldihydropteridine diphosphokinase